MSRVHAIASLSALIVLSSCVSSAPPVPAKKSPVTAQSTEVKPPPSLYHGKPLIGLFGVDLAGMDTSVKPGADFNLYAGGKWIKTVAIPPDQGHWDGFESLTVQVAERARALIEEQTRLKPVKGSNAQRIGDYYRTYIDRAAIDKLGFEPAKPVLDAIQAAKTTTDIAKLMGRPDLPCLSPMLAGVLHDPKNPDRYQVTIMQSGLVLPSREHYLKDDKEFKDIRTKYVEHVARVLTMVGDKQAAANARAILALETKFAEAHWTPAERRDQDKIYNPRTVELLEKEMPKFPWKAYFEAQGYGSNPGLILREVTAIGKMAEIFGSAPIATLKSYLTYHFLNGSSDVLPIALEKESFDFYGRVLSGETEPEQRWQLAVDTLNDIMGEAVGELYVARHFDPKARDEVTRIVENLRRAYIARIERLDWMGPETKKEALEKMATLKLKLGYPKKWRDYSALDIVPGDALGNWRRLWAWRQLYNAAKLQKPTDRDAWIYMPHMVDAGYLPNFNEIEFPAGILQPPFFDLEADPAVNYGAIGGVIGHEIGHALDDQGAKWDAQGIVRNWWTPGDMAMFKTRTDVLVEQYATYEPLPGLKINGRQTLGENIGDLGGILAAYDAYHLSLDGKSAETFNGFTGDQRFFLGWAQVWRRAYREEDLRNKVLTDMHSPAMFRVNGVVRNVDAWYAAFGIQAGDPLYLPPEKRVRIW